MSGRRFVAYTGEDGRSTFLSSSEPTGAVAYAATPGLENSLLWVAGPQAVLRPGQPDDPVPGAASLHPAPGGSAFMTLTLPPDSVYASPDFDPVTASTEFVRHAPGLAERMEPEAPGFHTTDTIDYAIVTSGELWLELDGTEAHLRAGDAVVQLGGRHAWRNRGDAPATIAVVLIGASRA